MRWTRCVSICLLLVAAARAIAAAEPAAPLAARIHTALELGLPLVEKAATRYPEHRKCFSCHHQTLPMMALVIARDAGRAIDEELLKTQAEFTHNSFARDLEKLNKGEGIGGRGLTVGYGLLTLSLVEWPADEVTAAMATYLLKTQEEDGHWQTHATRPPMEDSLQTITAIAAVGLQKYGRAATDNEAERCEQVAAATARAKAWLVASEPLSTEDKVARLWGLHDLAATTVEIESARAAVLAAQRADGGWPQLAEMESDAYATGQAMAVLLLTGLSPAAPECGKAIEHLLGTQNEDGSWAVKTRSKPVQVYFDNGDPHGKDQFISTPASCWALVAMALSQKP